VTNSNGTAVYYKVNKTSMTQDKVTTLKNNNTEINVRANASWGTGWISEGTINPATFANSATSGTTYVDISKTDAVPYLVKDSDNKFFLYINRGYVDNLKIDLGKLIPDTITGYTMATADYIRSGYAAFDGSGNIITGNIDKYEGEYVVSTT